MDELRELLIKKKPRNYIVDVWHPLHQRFTVATFWRYNDMLGCDIAVPDELLDDLNVAADHILAEANRKFAEDT